jgi:hypothetical protein
MSMSSDQSPSPAPALKRKAWQPPQLTQDILDQLEAEHEDLIIMRGDPDMSPWVMVLKRPTRPQTLLWKSNSRKTDGQQAVIANEQLIRATVVWPETHHVDAQIAKFSLMPDAIVNSERYRAFIGVAADADLKG